MHPIEKFHNMVTAGNILGPGGNWISRNEALKKKKTLLKHVFAGEVEKDGQWINVSDLQLEITPPPFSAPQPQSSGDDVIELSSTIDRENSTTVNLPPPPIVTSRAVQEPPPLIKALQEQKPPPQNIPDLAHKELDRPTRIPGINSAAEPVSASLAKHESTDHLPPQPSIGSPAAPPQSTDTFQRETITIRTIPLGKETSLTVSESRAGTALVAICSVQGFIDQSNADAFHAQLISMLDFGVRYFIIDFEQTTLVGSAGWGVLAVTARLIKASQGHLLLCSMKEEIEESFLLLQFNEVIDSRKTISDCLDVIKSTIKTQKTAMDDDDTASSVFPQYGDDYNDLPLPEKIKTVIAQNGPLSVFQIARHLKTERYGRIALNPLKLYFLLKEMNLDTRLKRTRYYRSC